VVVGVALDVVAEDADELTESVRSSSSSLAVVVVAARLT